MIQCLLRLPFHLYSLKYQGNCQEFAHQYFIQDIKTMRNGYFDNRTSIPPRPIIELKQAIIIPSTS
jgi:hypothetical protein